MIPLTIIQTIFNRLPEKLGKSQRSQSKVQRKRHTPLSNQDDGYNCHGNKDVETPYNLSKRLQNANSSTHSPFPTQSDVVDLGESPPPSLNPSHFPPIPERPPHLTFPRFLGPDSIEDLFRPESEYSENFVPPRMDSRVNSLSQNFDSLDQYVSTLDMQEEQQNPHGIDTPATFGSLAPYTNPGNATFDTSGVGPFVPLSPYLIQMYSHTGNYLVPSEAARFLADDHYTVDQNDNIQEAQLQEIADGQETLWTGAE